MKKQNAKKYHAFISYRHADNKEQGRQWATWLHQAIETYEVPADLIGKENARGETIPARIFPIFRDEEELPADADLGNAIVNALDQTRILVVLCSPRAVASTYVADEIHYFKKIGHSNRIIAAMIDGEPNTSWDKDKLDHGFKTEDECFPAPLQFEYDKDGNRTEKHAEPIAADFRINNEGVPEQGWTSIEAYRLHLKKSSKLDNKSILEKIDVYQNQQQLMLLKIIAGVIGVPLGELTQRDKEYQLELEKQKAKKLRLWLGAVAMLAVLAIGAGVLAWFQRQAAIENELIAVQRLKERMIADAERLTGEAIELLDQNNSQGALKKIFEALPPDIESPEWPIKQKTKIALNRAIAMHGKNILFKGPNDTVKKLQSLSNDRLIAFTEKNSVFLYTSHGKLLHQWQFDERLEYTVSEDGKRLVAAGYITREVESSEATLGKVYLNYFVAQTFDLDSGTLLSEVDKKIKTEGYSMIDDYYSRSSHFSSDGKKYIAKYSTYTDKEIYQLVITDTETGTIENTHDTTHSIKTATLLSNGGIITEVVRHASDNAPYHHALLYLSPQQKAFRKLIEIDRQPVCNNERLLKVADGDENIGGTFDYRGTTDNQFVIAKIRNINNSYDWCLLAWDLSSSESYKFGYFEHRSNNNSAPEKLALLELAYSTTPLLVQKNIEGDTVSVKEIKSAHIYHNNAFHFSATVNDDSIKLSHFIDEQITSAGGFINAITVDTDNETIWYSSEDGMIRSRELFSNTKFQYTKLKDVGKLYVSNNTIIAVDSITEDEEGFYTIQYNMMQTKDNNFGDTESLKLSDNQSVRSLLFAPNYLGILTYIENKEQSINLIPIAGENVTAPKNVLSHQARSIYNTPPTNSTHLAYRSNNHIVLYAMNNGQERTINLPDDVTLNEFMFLGEDLILSATDKKDDTWEKRVIKLFKLTMTANTQPELVHQKRAQGLEMQSMSKRAHLMLTWDIQYDRPKETEVISTTGKINKITTAWDDSYGLKFLIPESGGKIIVVEGNKKIRTFDYQGNLLSQTLTNQKWYSLNDLGATEEYIIGDNSFSFIKDNPNCSYIYDGVTDATYVDDNGGKYLVVMKYDTTKVYDLKTCTVLIDIPFGTFSGDLVHIGTDGVFRLGHKSWVATIKTDLDFKSNYLELANLSSKR